MAVKFPQRAEIYYVNWQGGVEPYNRPGPSLVVQNDTGNRLSEDVIVVPLTKTIKDYPFMVKVPLTEGGLTYDSCVDCGAIFTVPKTRLGNKVGRLPAARMAEVDAALKVALALK